MRIGFRRSLPASGERTESPRRSRTALRRFCRHRMAVACLFILAALMLMAALAPLIAPYSPTKPAGPFSQPPGGGHILGTDKIGRDMFSRILFAMQVSLRVGLLAVFSRTIHTIEAIAAVYPITWAVTAVCFVIAFFVLLRKKLQAGSIEETAVP